MSPDEIDNTNFTFATRNQLHKKSLKCLFQINHLIGWYQTQFNNASLMITKSANQRSWYVRRMTEPANQRPLYIHRMLDVDFVVFSTKHKRCEREKLFYRAGKFLIKPLLRLALRSYKAIHRHFIQHNISCTNLCWHGGNI